VSDWPRARRESFVDLDVWLDPSGFDEEASKLAAVEELTAVLFAAGAAGVEERIEEGREGHAGETRLIVYAPLASADAIGVAARECGARVGEPRPVEPVDWSRAWQAGFDAIEVSPALLIRPSFVSVEAKAGQREIVIDPGQAFGTGGHESTRLVLETIRGLFDEAGAPARVLDVGTGTGVLALAALALGAGRAIGFDLDPLAACEARRFAEANGLAGPFDVYAGGIGALAAAPFELVLANLLKREMLPIAGELAAVTAPDGRLVLSGLLANERDEVVAALSPFGLRRVDERSASDANGDRWISLLMARG